MKFLKNVFPLGGLSLLSQLGGKKKDKPAAQDGSGQSADPGTAQDELARRRGGAADIVGRY